MAPFDLLYFASHPLAAAIHRHRVQLEEKARAFPAMSRRRKQIEKRAASLAEYDLPMPDTRDLQQSAPLVNQRGEVVGEMHSIRRRLTEVRRGRPAQWGIKVRAALEEKLTSPNVTWRELAAKLGWKDCCWRAERASGVKMLVPGWRDLACETRRLKRLLRRERIPLRPAPDPSMKVLSLVDLFPDLITPLKNNPDWQEF